MRVKVQQRDSERGLRKRTVSSFFSVTSFGMQMFG